MGCRAPVETFSISVWKWQRAGTFTLNFYTLNKNSIILSANGGLNNNISAGKNIVDFP